MNEALSSFGHRIRLLRHKRGWSLTDLATRAELSRSYLFQLEQDKSSPTLRKIESLASAFDLALTELLQGQAPTDKAQGITCDPRIQFGAPCISGTRVTTESVYAMYLGGESVAGIADCYGIHPDDVRTAVQLQTMWELQTQSPWALIWEGSYSKLHDLWWRFRGWLGGCGGEKIGISPRRILKYAFKGVCIIVLYEIMQEIIIGVLPWG